MFDWRRLLTRWSLIASSLAISWLLMQAIHEWGHMLMAWLTGGEVVRLILHPLAISRTDVSPNFAPLLVAWGGPIIGTLLPLIAWLALVTIRSRWRNAAAFFAGFCAISNGLYLAVGSIEGVGDAGDLLRDGAPHWSLLLFGAITIPIGLALWHRLGARFGLAQLDAPAIRRAAIILTAALIVVVTLECLLSQRY